MFCRHSPQKLIWPAAGFVLLCGVYYFWAWSHVLGDFGGDNAFYLLIARYFSPWSARSDVAAYFFAHSLYPPSYPFVLAIFGGGESLLAAHLVTVTCLLLAFTASYIWLRALDVPVPVVCLLILLFALLPGTYMQALEILSENLYLLLTLACLAAVATYENDKRHVWLWIAVATLAAATLTRSAGVSLLAAFVLYLLLHRPPRFWVFAVAAAAPMVVWGLFSGQEAPGYLASFMEKYKTDPVATFIQHLAVEGRLLWYSWVGNFTVGSSAKPVAGFLGMLCLLGMVYRAYLRKLDGFYATAYLALVLVWPFPAEVQRLLFVIMPVLLAQGVLLLGLLPKLRISQLKIRPVYILFLAVSLIVIPDLVLTIKRFLEPMPEELVEYRRTPGWYEIDPYGAHMNTAASKELIAHLNSLQTVVPENECVYGIKPSIVGYYAGRISTIPPRPHFDQAAFDAYLRKTNCRYFYMVAFSSPSFQEPYYPLARLRASLRIISKAPVADNQAGPVGVLAELEHR